jgi:hypothetical protein
MFDPSKTKADKAKKAQKKKVINELVDWSATIVPINLREGWWIEDIFAVHFIVDKTFTML